MNGAVPTALTIQYIGRKFGKKIVFFDVPSVATLRAVKIKYFENVQLFKRYNHSWTSASRP